MIVRFLWREVAMECTVLLVGRSPWTFDAAIDSKADIVAVKPACAEAGTRPPRFLEGKVKQNPLKRAGSFRHRLPRKWPKPNAAKPARTVAIAGPIIPSGRIPD
jgi:hypothetical protein